MMGDEWKGQGDDERWIGTWHEGFVWQWKKKNPVRLLLMFFFLEFWF